MDQSARTERRSTDPMMRPVIVFDLFGVLLSKGLQSSLKRLEAVLKRPAGDIAPVYEALEREFDTGLIDETRFWNALNAALGTRVSPRYPLIRR